MEIDRALNIVFRIDGIAGPVQVHATPLSETAFRHNFMLVAKVYATLTADRLLAAGPRIAAMLVEKVAADGGEPAVGAAFLAELRRSAHVFARQGDQWLPLPLQVALDREIIAKEDAAEVENLLAFFMCVSAMTPRKLQRELAQDLMGASGGHTTHLSAMEYAASLQM